jgi:hypothetical protein
VGFKLRKPTTGGVRGHGCAEGPLIDGGRLVFLEQRRSDERFEDKPTAEVDAGWFDDCR